MENIFKNVDDKELREIYKDYLRSKDLGIRVTLLDKYAKEIKQNYFSNVNYSLGMCMNLAEKIFLWKLLIDILKPNKLFIY